MILRIFLFFFFVVVAPREVGKNKEMKKSNRISKPVVILFATECLVCVRLNWL